MTEFQFLHTPPLTNDELNVLFAAAWPKHEARDFRVVLARSLGYIAVRHHERLVGFVNIAWDGGDHAFLLDPTVHPDFQRRGLGSQLLQQAAVVARVGGAEWLHVDFAHELEGFYRAAGFQPTSAGLLHFPAKATS